MTDNELLLAFSNMLDTKLKPLDVRLERIEGSIGQLEERMDRLEERMDRLEDRMERVEAQIVMISNWTVQIDDRTKKLEVLVEYDIKSRLQNIEACYLSTFERYKSGVEQIDTMQVDVDIIKKVLEDHSRKFQKIS